MTERTFNVFTGNAASDRFCNSTYVEAGTAEQPVRLLLFRGESHREFMIELDSEFKPVAMQVRRERGRMVERPTEVGKGSCTRLAMLPAWESAGWDEWTAIELKTHELDAPALMEGFLATKEGRDFLFGIEKKKEEPKTEEKKVKSPYTKKKKKKTNPWPVFIIVSGILLLTILLYIIIANKHETPARTNELKGYQREDVIYEFTY